VFGGSVSARAQNEITPLAPNPTGIALVPDRSGLPSGNRGKGAERFGSPSGIREMLAGGTFTRCA